MEHLDTLIASVIPKERRKVGQNLTVASKHPGYWTDSSTDLRTGLDVVELPAEGQWPDTVPLETEPRKRGTVGSD